MAARSGGGPPPTNRLHWESGPADDLDPAVTIDMLDGGVVQVRLSSLAATRLIMALGVGTAGHSSEVADLLTGLVILTTGVTPGTYRETQDGHLGRGQINVTMDYDDAALWDAIADLRDTVGRIQLRIIKLEKKEAK